VSNLFSDAGLPHTLLPDAELVEALQLIRSENIGAVTFHALVARFSSPKRALASLPEFLATRKTKRPISLAGRDVAEKELEAAGKFGAVPVLYGSPLYPARLAQLNDAPPILFALGCTELLEAPRMLAMVGARNASAQGFAFARQLARDAVAAGILPISGLARGIDAAAHQGALEAEAGATIGVIAGGINTIYPTENAKLYERMRHEGLILSEQPFGMEPQARAFPARNRIIAGLAQATLVVEAALRSGSLITAEYAADAGREVFAVPGNPLDPRVHGTNKLLKQGAHLTEGMEDILAHWPQSLMQTSPRTNLERVEPVARHAPAPTEAIQPLTPEAGIVLSTTESSITPSTTESLGAHIRAKLSHSMVLVDELAAQCNVPPGLLQAVLIELELDGTILRGPGNRVALRAA
jgi:DNA processing protein